MSFDVVTLDDGGNATQGSEPMDVVTEDASVKDKVCRNASETEKFFYAYVEKLVQATKLI